MRRFTMSPVRWSLWLIALMAGLGGSVAAAEYSVHDDQIYLLAQDGELFYPRVANAGFLLGADVSSSRRAEVLDRLAAHEINAIRLGVDDAIAREEPLLNLQDEDGYIREAILTRLDALFQEAARRGLGVILGLFDFEDVAAQWPDHRWHSSYGGPCERVRDYFLDNDLQQDAMRRVEQLAERYGGAENLLSWELARGANVFEAFIREDPEIREHVMFWTVLMQDALRQAEPERNLVAISGLPNTFPAQLMRMPDWFFLQFDSSEMDNGLRSLPGYIQQARIFKKPVFVAEADWSGDEDLRPRYVAHYFWLAMAQSSGLFLSPVEKDGRWSFADAALELAANHAHFSTRIHWAGVPRPASRVPIETVPQDAYQIEEVMVGNDRLFWIRRLEPQDAKVQIQLRTVPGKYEYQWFDLEGMAIGRSKSFTLNRIDLRMQSPDFHSQIMGRLRLVERKTNEPD